MHICYVDEAGCTGILPHAHSPVQPVLVIAGVAFDQAHLHAITLAFLNLKQRFFPGSQIGIGNPPVRQSPPFFLDWVLAEIKGSDLRRGLWAGGRNRRRQVLVFLDHFLRFLANYNARIMGRVLIKGIGIGMNGRAIYASSIQTMFSTFNNYLDVNGSQGFLVMDSRRKDQNV